MGLTLQPTFICTPADGSGRCLEKNSGSHAPKETLHTSNLFILLYALYLAFFEKSKRMSVCLQRKISLTTEPIWFSILENLHFSPGVVLGHIIFRFQSWDGFRFFSTLFYPFKYNVMNVNQEHLFIVIQHYYQVLGINNLQI